LRIVTDGNKETTYFTYLLTHDVVQHASVFRRVCGWSATSTTWVSTGQTTTSQCGNESSNSFILITRSAFTPCSSVIAH